MSWWSDSPLVRRPIGPKTHWSDGPLVQFSTDKGVWFWQHMVVYISAFFGPMTLFRTNGFSDQWHTFSDQWFSDQWHFFEPMRLRTNGFSDQWAVGPMGFRTNGSSDQWAVGPSTWHPKDEWLVTTVYRLKWIHVTYYIFFNWHQLRKDLTLFFWICQMKGTTWHATPWLHSFRWLYNYTGDFFFIHDPMNFALTADLMARSTVYLAYFSKYFLSSAPVVSNCWCARRTLAIRAMVCFSYAWSPVPCTEVTIKVDTAFSPPGGGGHIVIVIGR